MKTYTKVEFSPNDLYAVRHLASLMATMERFGITNEMELCSLNAFTGNLEKIANFMAEHMEDEEES